MQPDISYQVSEPGWGQDVSHSDSLLVNSLGETGGADGGESGSWMPFPLELSPYLRLVCCQQSSNTDIVTEAMLATGPVPGSGWSPVAATHNISSQTQTRDASGEGPPLHPSISPAGNNSLFYIYTEQNSQYTGNSYPDSPFKK